MQVVSKILSASMFVAVLGTNAQASECDLEAGKKAFNKCRACHSLAQGAHMMGPSLNGVVDRKAGQLPGFLFSQAMQDSGLIWDVKTLDDFLTQPMIKVPGTSMPFAGIKNEQVRNSLICYIQAQSNAS